MSDIETNLLKILESRYGADVRQAIHDSIHDCYEDGKAGAVDLTARKQIANLVANVPSGSEKDSELVDIRVGYDGTAYPSAGEAVRGQIGILHEELDKYTTKYTNWCGNSGINQIFTITAPQSDVLVEGGIDIETDDYRPNEITDYLAFIELEFTEINSANSGELLPQLFGTKSVIVNLSRENKAITLNEAIVGKKYYTYAILSPTEIDDYCRLRIRGTNLTGGCSVSFKITKAYVFNNYDENTIPSAIYYPYMVPLIYLNIGKSVGIDNLKDDLIDLLGLPSLDIDCWGDSLTQGGADGTNITYPSLLQTLINDNGFKNVVNNMGVGGENTRTIAFRQGGNSLVVNPKFNGSTSIVIHESNAVGTPISNTLDDLYDMTGRAIKPTMQGYAGINPCYLDGIKGFLYSTGSDENSYYYFARESSGEARVINRPTSLITDASINNKKRIFILMFGHNGGWDNVDDYIHQIKQIINWSGSNRYIICGIPSGSYEERWELETRMLAEFGRHFLNTREYVCNYGLDDNELTPTEDDTANMELGIIPPQLRIDSVHFNTYGNTALSNCIYKKLIELNYLTN